MRRILAILITTTLFVPAAYSDEIIFPSGNPAHSNGGLMIIRQGNTTTCTLGGGVLPRMVKVTTATPEGPIITKFTWPSNFHPDPFIWPESAPATLCIGIPDVDGLIYVEGQLIRGHGMARLLQSPPLPPYRDCPLHLRAAYKIGDFLLIEERLVIIHAGENVSVPFDGSKALAVRLSAEDVSGDPFAMIMKR
jgi:hypothetical protein